MVKHNIKLKIARLGVNYVTNIVDTCDCYFNKIEQENDVGIDGIIEFTDGEKPSGRCIAVQIKTGESYFNKKNNECIIPIEGHYEYWKNYCMPVYGIVCSLEDNIAYWIDIKQYLSDNSLYIEKDEFKQIKFKMRDINKFDVDSFNTFFRAGISRSLPQISYEQACKLIQSLYSDEICIGINILASIYSNKVDTWNMIYHTFIKAEDQNVLNNSIGYLAYVPGHGDLYGNLNFTPESKEYAKKLIDKTDLQGIIKMLRLIDENEIDRGTIGQDVEAIISSISNVDKILLSIIQQDNLEEEIINRAVIILAYSFPKQFKEAINKNQIKTNWVVELITNAFNEYGYFDLY